MKFLAAFITAAMTATMLSLGLAAPAQADHGYSSHIDTRMSAWSKRNPVRKRQRAPFAVRIETNSGRTPRARLTVRVERRGNGKVVWRGTRRYKGGTQTYRTGRLPRGKFNVFVIGDVNAGRFEDARARFGQRAVRR